MDLEQMINAKVEAILAEQVEAIARKRVEALLGGNGNGNGDKPVQLELPAAEPPRKLTGKNSPRIYQGDAELMRGKVKPQKACRPGTMQAEVLQLAWDSLHPDGHFTSGHAQRRDLTAYLMASLPHITAGSFSSTISRAIREGVLVVVPPGF